MSPHLVSHVVLHVHVSAAQHLQAEGTQQVLGVLVDAAEVRLHVGEERRAVVTHLREVNLDQHSF